MLQCTRAIRRNRTNPLGGKRMEVSAGSAPRPARSVFGCLDLSFRRGLPLVATLLAAVLMLAAAPVQAGEGAAEAPAAETPGKDATKDAPAAEAADDILKIRILMAREIQEDKLPPLSLLDIPPS